MSTPEEIVRRLLAQVDDPEPEIINLQTLHTRPRSVVWRGQLNGLWRGQDRIVAKQVVGDGAAMRFERELAVLRLLVALDINPPVAPKLLAWDTSARILLMEDLGDQSLATAFSGEDRPAANIALLDYAAALGRLHANTASLSKIRTVASLHQVALDCIIVDKPRDLPGDGANFHRFCTTLGVALTPSFDDDIRQVQTLLAAPGPFRVLTHGDPCPDNERRTAAGVVFFDFEASCFDHALLDAAYLPMAFPSCWCVGMIPAKLLNEAQVLYRHALVAGIPEAGEDTLYNRHLLHACARWLLTDRALVPRMQHGDSSRFMALLEQDWPWGPSTARQRLLHRLDAFNHLARKVGELDSLRAAASRLHHILASRWPAEAHRLANHPVFVDS